MTQIKNSAPQILFWGFDDQSGRIVPTVPEQLPIHLPFIYTYARKGDTTPKFVAGKALIELLGAETLDYRSPYATHATPFINGFNEAANIMLIQRLRPADAKTSSMQLGIELLPTSINAYERNEDGSFKRDPQGAKISTGTVYDGFLCKWSFKEVTAAVGTSTTSEGTLVDGDVQSTFYPIIDLAASSFGGWGNDTGIRLYPRFNMGLDPVDEDLVLSQKAFAYGLQIMERANANSSPNVWKTLTGARSVELMFKEGTFNPATEIEMHWDEVVLPQYRNTEEGQDGPFEHAFLYQENVETVLGLLADAEKLAGFMPAEEDHHMINFADARDIDGVPYHAIEIQGMLDGAMELTEVSTYYQLGGADGTMGNAAYNADVANQLANFGDLDFLYEDMAKYPFSAFYDTGFDLETKKLIPSVLGLRADTHVALACQDVMRPANSVDEDSSLGVSLRSALAAYPESLIYGTSVCRGVIVPHSGNVVDSTYKGIVPGTYEIAMKRARYLGAGNGIAKARWAYDQPGMNIVTYMKNVTNLDKPQSVRNKDWDRGLTYFQNYDTRRAFHPMTRSVYEDDTSILTSEIVMQFAVNCNRVAFHVWRELVGNGKLNDEQFIQHSNRKIQEKTNGRFDGRCVIVPETYYTAADVARGYSWSSRIHLYAPNTKTVSATSVVTHRLEDLGA